MEKVLNAGLYFEQLYLDWTNNYLTLEKFANDYKMTLEEAGKKINIGRKIHNQNIEYRKAGLLK